MLEKAANCSATCSGVGLICRAALRTAALFCPVHRASSGTALSERSTGLFTQKQKRVEEIHIRTSALPWPSPLPGWLALMTSAAPYHAEASELTAPEGSRIGPVAGSGKVSIFSYIFHEHSFLGLFVPDDHVSPPIQPCCCLCVFTDELTRRHRLFVFTVVFALMLYTSVQVDLDHDDIWSNIWAMMVQVFVLVPVTCHLKSNLPRYSAWFAAKGIGPFGPPPHVRGEEILLVLGAHPSRRKHSFSFCAMFAYTERDRLPRQAWNRHRES